MKMLSRRGYSLTMWTVVFGVVVFTIGMFLMPVKRALTSKTLRLSDHFIWGYWGDAVRQDGMNSKGQIGAANSNSTMTSENRHTEDRGVITSVDKFEVSSTSDHSNF